MIQRPTRRLTPPFALLTLLLALLATGGPAWAQPTLWQHVLGGSMADQVVAFEGTPDGGHIVVGTVRSNDVDGLAKSGLDADVWVIKLSAKGDVAWQKRLGGTFTDEGRDVKVTQDDGFVIVGTTDSKEFTDRKRDVYVVRLDALGNILWQKAYGGFANEEAHHVILTPDGGMVVVGVSGTHENFLKPFYGSIDAYILRLDAKGNVLWQSAYGGKQNDAFLSVAPAHGGGWLVLGETESNDGLIPEHRGKKDFLVVKYDDKGEVLWEKTYGGANYDIPHALIPTIDGNYLLAGTTFSTDGHIKLNKGEGDVWVIKINPNGGIIWERTYGGSGDEGANGIAAIPYDNAFLITATSRSSDGDLVSHRGLYDAWVFKIDNNGNIIWQKSYGGKQNDMFMAGEQNPYEDYFIIGTTSSSDGDLADQETHGSEDAYILCLRDPISPPQATSYPPTALIGYVKDKSTGKYVAAEISAVHDSVSFELSSAKTDTATGTYLLLIPHTLTKIRFGVVAKGYMYARYEMEIKPEQRFGQIRFDIELDPIKVGTSFSLTSIYFDIGSANLTAASLPELDKVAEFMKTNPKVVIQVNGHTDNTGAPQTKMQLSEMRAEAVKKYIVSQGINHLRVYSRGFGMNKPIATNDTEDGRALNRRVEFQILQN